MHNQSSKYILPFSAIVIIALIALLSFVFLADENGWFNDTDELIAQFEDDDEVVVVSFPEDNLLRLTEAEVAEFNTVDNCYTIIDDVIYEFSEEFIESDENDLFDELVCGNDSTEAFNTQVDYTVNDIAEFIVGEVVLVSDSN